MFIGIFWLSRPFRPEVESPVKTEKNGPSKIFTFLPFFRPLLPKENVS